MSLGTPRLACNSPMLNGLCNFPSSMAQYIATNGSAPQTVFILTTNLTRVREIATDLYDQDLLNLCSRMTQLARRHSEVRSILVDASLTNRRLERSN